MPVSRKFTVVCRVFISCFVSSLTEHKIDVVLAERFLSQMQFKLGTSNVSFDVRAVATLLLLSTLDNTAVLWTAFCYAGNFHQGKVAFHVSSLLCFALNFVIK